MSGFGQVWDGKYPEIAKAWRKNWTELTAFFGFNWAVRRIMYTTNAVEGI
ncbi:MAG: transposase [Saprospiraceae bacterium]